MRFYLNYLNDKEQFIKNCQNLRSLDMHYAAYVLSRKTVSVLYQYFVTGSSFTK